MSHPSKHLSVALATFNEEENIRRCLDSVKDIASEIVIVDGTSTDRTVEIAQEYGAKIIVRENPPIFHINKQIALDKCTNPWILQMDADEVVSAELGKEIIEEIEKKDQENNGFWMSRKNYFLGRFLMKGGQFPDYTIRLYRKGKAYLPQKSVHEQAVVEGKVGYLHHSLLHYPYKSFGFYIFKWNRYCNLIAKEIRDEQKKKNMLQKIFIAIGYLILKPAHWFLTTYIRHKGFYDGWQGFVFSFFSAMRFPVSYIKFLFGKK